MAQENLQEWMQIVKQTRNALQMVSEESSPLAALHQLHSQACSSPTQLFPTGVTLGLLCCSSELLVEEYSRLWGVHGLGGVADVLGGVEHSERQPGQEIPGGEQACHRAQPKPSAA